MIKLSEQASRPISPDLTRTLSLYLLNILGYKFNRGVRVLSFKVLKLLTNISCIMSHPPLNLIQYKLF